MSKMKNWMMDIEEFCDGYYPENLSDNINVAGNHKEPPLEKCWEKMQSKDVAYRSISASKRGMMVLKKKKIRSNKRPAWQSPYPL